jgi:hypothetical protein
MTLLSQHNEFSEVVGHGRSHDADTTQELVLPTLVLFIATDKYHIVYRVGSATRPTKTTFFFIFM